jgi:hypothetical protein
MSRIVWSVLEKAKGPRTKGFGFSGPKKAKKVGMPLGSVKVKDGKRYMKTETGWKVMKSIRLTIPVKPKETEES